MKAFTVAVLVTALLGGIWFLSDIGWRETVTNHSSSTPQILEAELPEWAKDEDAVQAAKEVIQRKELEKELQSLNSEKEERVATHEKELGELETKITAIENQLSF